MNVNSKDIRDLALSSLSHEWKTGVELWNVSGQVWTIGSFKKVLNNLRKEEKLESRLVPFHGKEIRQYRLRWSGRLGSFAEILREKPKFPEEFSASLSAASRFDE